MVDKFDQLEKLKKLHDEGVLNKKEFDLEKKRILNIHPRSSAGDGERYWGMEERTYCMVLHLSQLTGLLSAFMLFVLPFIGIILPLVMWLTQKDRSEVIDNHGRIVINWIISYVIYFALSLVLSFIIIGIPLLIALVVANIIFIIVGAVKASNGETWKYPLSIPFLRDTEASAS